MKKTSILLIGFSLFIISCHAPMDKTQESVFSQLTGPYLGQDPPGTKAEVFAPNIISTAFNEAICTFTPNGKEVFFRILGPPRGGIFFTKEVNGKWIEPQPASFIGNYDAKCNLSPDGNKLVFSSGMPHELNGEELYHWEIWIVERTEEGWGTPINLGTNVNSSEYSLVCPTIANSGNIYFYSEKSEGSFGKADIWMTEYKNGQYSKIVNLGSTINTQYWENDPFIAPDESYIIFQSTREGDHRYGDLFISYKNELGEWTEPLNMGERVNAPYSGEGCPMVSPDGKYFFFSGGKRSYKSFMDKPLTYKEKMAILSNPGNMSEDIFWIDAKILEELRPKIEHKEEYH